MRENFRLVLALQPGGVLTLEREPGPPVGAGKAFEAIESDMVSIFKADPALFLIKLGLANPTLPLPPTLRFWHNFGAIFCRAIMLLPDVETRRGDSRAALSEADIRLLLEAAPPMPGAEYLGPDVLREYWQEMHLLLGDKLAFFPGSVEDWFNSISGAAREIG